MKADPLYIRVDPSLTVPAVSPIFTGFADMPPVFATAFMVGFVEWACIEAIRPLLNPGEQTVGTHIDISHSAATPVGMLVSAQVELTEVRGRRLRFRVFCRDEAGVIGQGVHERCVIQPGAFLARAEARAVEVGLISRAA